ncbi:STAS domain-containing protein [Ilumatobacter nonamiensis]|uniref:STAS domain-containing protein n=1 Tax=Ilumatobacter nonamiensis TaxID=467093 RepID=UPI00034DF0FC|nr:STAS domain-containing protein [Ilumatobacter nonamiensis]
MSDALPRLTVSVQDSDVVVSGDIDAHTCPDLTAVLEPLPGDGDVRVDTSSVGFMDSSGLRVLISAHQAAEASGRRLVIDRPSSPVIRLIEVSGLSDHLHVEGNE